MEYDTEAEKDVRRRCLDERIGAEARLIAALAHKVNNSLAYTVNYLFVLDRSLKDDASRELAQKIRQGLEKTAGIFGGLVDAAGTPAARPARLDVRTVIESCMADYPRGGPLVVTNAVEEGAAVVADAERVGSVLRAFLDNARDAGARHAVVTCDGQGGRPRIAVSDDGEGVAPEDVESLFDPFFTTRKSRQGLGLYTAYHVARSMGGHIGYEANSLAGSVFSLYLSGELVRNEG